MAAINAPDPLAFSFNELLECLAKVHEVAPDGTPAFSAQLRNLQRIEFPPGVNTGKGRRAYFGPNEVLMILFALELMAIGFTQFRAVSAINLHWHLRFIQKSVDRFKTTGGLISWVLYDYRSGGTASEQGGAILSLNSIDDPDLLADLQSIISRKRAVLINVSDLVTRLDQALGPRGDSFWNVLRLWKTEPDLVAKSIKVTVP